VVHVQAKGLCETFPMRLHNTRLVIKAHVCKLFREVHTLLDGESEVTCQLGEVGRCVEQMSCMHQVHVDTTTTTTTKLGQGHA
jgi:hypothetical protein